MFFVFFSENYLFIIDLSRIYGWNFSRMEKYSYLFLTKFTISMKIFTSEDIRKCDQYTITHEPVSSVQLMERAALACASWIAEHCKSHKNIAVFCGTGNNGGDGLAIARLLHSKGFDVEIFINNLKAKFSEDATANMKKLRDIPGLSVKSFKDKLNYRFDNKTIIIDALFGTGLSRPLEEDYKEVVNQLNTMSNIRIAIDIPSGLPADGILKEDAVVLKADYTLSFQFWKKSFLHPETGKFAGKVVILDIHLSEDFIEATDTEDYVIDDSVIESIFMPREDFTHKGSYGKVLLAAGSYGKIGAAVLATKAALRTGAGLTFTLAPACGYRILQASCPEAMFIEGGDQFTTHFEHDEDAVYGIGPGLGKEPETSAALMKFLKKHKKPLVLDADALNMLAENEKYLRLIPEYSIITPHPKEFERLFGKTDNSFDRLELARRKAAEYKIHIVLKDHHTQVVSPEGRVFYNINGNSGLAKGGSGDILTGIITSLLAQGYSEENSAVLGIWLHGRAADFAAEKYSKEAMLPTDVIDSLSRAFEDLNKKVMVKL